MDWKDSNRPSAASPTSSLWTFGCQEGVGFLIAERLKNVGLGHVPVIFLSASKKKQLWKIAREVEPAGFFEKPYDPKQLLAAIGRALIQYPPAQARTNVSSRTDG